MTQYIIKCSNASKKRNQRGSVSVYSPDGSTLLARVYADVSNLYKFICKNHCSARTSLVQQLMGKGISQKDIQEILSDNLTKKPSLFDMLTFRPSLVEMQFGKEPCLLDVLKEYYYKNGFSAQQTAMIVDQYVAQLESYSKQNKP